MKSVFKCSNLLLNMGFTFLHCITDIKQRYTNSQGSKLMTMYQTHKTKNAFIFTKCTYTLFAGASLCKTILRGKITVLCKEGKLFEDSDRHITLSDTCSYSKSQHHCQAGQWAWINRDLSCTQMCTHTYAKLHMSNAQSLYVKQASKYKLSTIKTMLTKPVLNKGLLLPFLHT